MSSPAVHAPVRPVHDRPTLVSYASLATWSWFVYGFGASLALLRDDQGTSAWLGGLHSTALAAGGIIGALLTPRLNHRFGRGPVWRGAAIGTALCIVWYLWPGMPVGGTLTAIFVTCFFGNIVVVCINSFIATHQGAASAPAFTESTGLAALMGLLAPLGIGLAASTVLGWRTGLLVSVVAFACVELWRGRQLAVYGAPGQVLTRKEAGALPSRTWWALTAGMTYIGAEFCLSLWGADLLRERAGLSPAAAAAGLSTILGGLFVGRVFGVQIAERMSTERLLRLSIIAGFVAFCVAWLVDESRGHPRGAVPDGGRPVARLAAEHVAHHPRVRGQHRPSVVARAGVHDDGHRTGAVHPRCPGRQPGRARRLPHRAGAARRDPRPGRRAPVP